MTPSESARSGDPRRLLVMTGGTSGIGRRMLERLIADRPGWEAIVLARRGPACDSLAAMAAGSGRLAIVEADLASLAAVDRAADAVIGRLAGRPIDALALNAGVQAVAGDQASQDGLEITFAVNHLAHYRLADRLAGHLRPAGRLVVTSSVVHDPAAFCLVGLTRADWQPLRRLADPARAQDHLRERVDRGEARYCASKLLNLMTARHLAVRHPDLTVLAFNPGLVPGTDIGRERNMLQVLAWKYLLAAMAPILPATRTLDRAADDLLRLLTDAHCAAPSGSYVDGRTVAPGSADSRDPAKIAEMVGTSDEIIAGIVAGTRGMPRHPAAPP